MPEKMMPKMVVAVANNDDDLQLTHQECRLLRNFRAMNRSGQDLFVDMSEQYKRAMPAEPTKLVLL